MKNILIILFSLVLFSEAKSQTFMERGLLRAEGWFAPGVMLNQKATNFYIHGDLEYYIDRHISIRGDGFFFIGSSSDQKPFEFHHSWFSGAAWHFGKTSTESSGMADHFDPYIGFAPGLSITKSVQGVQILPGEFQSTKFNPLFSPYLGFNFYAQKIFHLFVEARYVGGTHFPDYAAPVSLSEIRFSFGLGWNLKTAGKRRQG
ncbi:MAG: hypothetical protein FD123_1958 [Bacteroidetes bacterium]|nr:MAG: hypothetical protein FD123_1958 [Bacteroidota bacterium]